jgi:uncharacterized protein involved in type VI secretion and phage assembly
MTDGLTPSIVLGKVIDTEDPEGRMRVRLQRLDQPGDMETDWAEVVSPMASNNAGFHFLPEPDDIAVIAFFGERPMVIGYIYTPNVELPTSEPTERIIQSVDGNALVLIDGDKSGITLRDKHKNEITMNADGITIKTDKDFTIEAKGKATIKGSTVELNP